MAIRTLADLKLLFESGDQPKAQDYIDLIDTLADVNAFWPDPLPAADAAALTNLTMPDPLPALDAQFLYNVFPSQFTDLAVYNPTYADATSFTLTGDRTALFPKKRRLRLTIDGAYFYTTPTDAVYNAGADATVVTILDAMPSNLLEAVGISIFTPIDYGGAISAEMVGVVQSFYPTPTEPNSMAIQIGAGRQFDGSNLVATAQANTPAFTAPVTDPRIDRVAINRTTGAIEIVAGTEDPAPTPAAYSNTQLPVCRVALYVGMTEITADDITIELISDSSYALDATRWGGGTKTISTGTPSGGVDNDVWPQVDP